MVYNLFCGGDMPDIASQDVYAALFDRIVSGELSAGMRLKEVALAAEFGLSRTPVRDALRQLARDGLVEIVTAQGARVILFGADDVEDVYDIRMALELLALDINGHALRLQPLTELREQLRRAAEGSDLNEHADIDAKLHRYVVVSTGRRYLLKTFDDMGRLMQRFRYLGFKDPQVIRRAAEEHMAFIEALLVRDVDTARRVLTDHIRNSKICALEQLHQGTGARGCQPLVGVR